jgi:hypothetical protein
MKKYKLIKEYPGSPEIKSIAKKEEKGYNVIDNKSLFWLTDETVENYPEFWEEVEEENPIYISEASNVKVYPDKKYWFINTPIGYGSGTYDYWMKHYVKSLDNNLNLHCPIAFETQEEAKDYCFRNQPLYTYDNVKSVVLDIILMWDSSLYNGINYDDSKMFHQEREILKKLMEVKKRI